MSDPNADGASDKNVSKITEGNVVQPDTKDSPTSEAAEQGEQGEQGSPAEAPRVYTREEFVSFQLPDFTLLPAGLCTGFYVCLSVIVLVGVFMDKPWSMAWTHGLTQLQWFGATWTAFYYNQCLVAGDWTPFVWWTGLVMPLPAVVTACLVAFIPVIYMGVFLINFMSVIPFMVAQKANSAKYVPDGVDKKEAMVAGDVADSPAIVAYYGGGVVAILYPYLAILVNETLAGLFLPVTFAAVEMLCLSLIGKTFTKNGSPRAFHGIVPGVQSVLGFVDCMRCGALMATVLLKPEDTSWISSLCMTLVLNALNRTLWLPHIAFKISKTPRVLPTTMTLLTHRLRFVLSYVKLPLLTSFPICRVILGTDPVTFSMSFILLVVVITAEMLLEDFTVFLLETLKMVPDFSKLAPTTFEQLPTWNTAYKWNGDTESFTLDLRFKPAPNKFLGMAFAAIAFCTAQAGTQPIAARVGYRPLVLGGELPHPDLTLVFLHWPVTS